MKRWFYIGIVLLVAVLVSCERLPRPAATPSQRGTTSPWPSPGGEGVASRMLESIDSLMWQQPDSAFAVLQEFASSAAADSLDEFNGHYCQLLISELLYKNDYVQSNRKDLLKALDYFDSIDDGFLAARAHYINGVGYVEKDSVVEACVEYLCALRTMESHYPENKLVGTKARFMVLAYNRLVDLFSNQYMLESVIICGKQALHYDAIEPLSPTNRANVLYRIGTHYDMLKEADSAAFYYEAAMKAMTGRNSMVYRDLISSMAYHEYSIHHDTVNSLDSLKRMVTLSVDERERLVRFLTIGAIYHDMEQYDSAKVYLEPVLENSPDKAEIAAGFLRDIAISEADTLKTEQYARLLVKDASKEVESQARVSKLNDIFQQHLQWEQDRAKEEEHRRAVQRNRWIWMAIAGLLLLVAIAIVVARRGYGKRLKLQQEELGKQLEAAQDALKVKEKDALFTKVNAIYQDKLSNKAKRIFEAFSEAHPDAVAKLKTSYPDLTDTEVDVCVLSHFAFRVKEIADILELRENTVAKHRSSIKKKTQIEAVKDLMQRFI